MSRFRACALLSALALALVGAGCDGNGDLPDELPDDIPTELPEEVPTEPPGDG